MIAHSAVQYVGVESMLHMTCVGSTKQNVSGYLEKAKGLGLRNILALRGDLPNIDEEWQFDPEKFNKENISGEDKVIRERRKEICLTTSNKAFPLYALSYISGYKC